MNNKIAYIFFVLVLGFSSCDEMTQKEFFDKVVFDEYHSKYNGLVTKKYIDEQNHARPIIIIKNQIFAEDERDFVFQSSELFDFIKVGDTISKNRKSLLINIKRINLDTIIKLDFGNIKGKEKYYSENEYLMENK